MEGLLEMPAVREQVHRMSVTNYHREGEAGLLGEDVELLRGLVVTKTSKSSLHEFEIEKMLDRLQAQAPKEFRVRKESPRTFRDSEPEPDISVVRGAPEDWLAAHPSTAQLGIEIAIRSVEPDKGKADIYAEADIPEYWLFRPGDRAIDVYRQSVHGK